MAELTIKDIQKVYPKAKKIVGQAKVLHLYWCAVIKYHIQSIQ